MYRLAYAWSGYCRIGLLSCWVTASRATISRANIRPLGVSVGLLSVGLLSCRAIVCQRCILREVSVGLVCGLSGNHKSKTNEKQRNCCSKLFKKERKKYYKKLDLKSMTDDEEFWKTIK